MSFVDETSNIEDATDVDGHRCNNCGGFIEAEECDCCQSCDGVGYIEDGGCGGGCDFCRPFPACGECRGSGKRQ